MYFSVKVQSLQFTVDLERFGKYGDQFPDLEVLEVQSSPCSGLQKGVTPLLALVLQEEKQTWSRTGCSVLHLTEFGEAWQAQPELHG